MTPMPIGFIGSRGSCHATLPHQQPTFLLFTITTYHATITPLWYILPFLSHTFSSSCFTFVCLSSSIQFTWFANTALVTSVYPNQMQYAPCVLQEVSLLDGIDAGVHGNSRRFIKTSSYPPCHHYVFHFLYPYFLTTSSSPLFLLIHSFSQPTSTLFHFTNHSHAPYCLCFLLFLISFPPFPTVFVQLSYLCGDQILCVME